MKTQPTRGRPPIKRRQAHIKHHLITTGYTGADVHRHLLASGYLVSAATVYSWIAGRPPGPDAEAVRLIAELIGRQPNTLYRKK